MTLQTQETALEPQVENLVGELRDLIDQARSSIATTVNSTLTLLYWHMGNRIHKEILNEERAEYGRAIVATVSRQLTTQYGKGFTEKGLRRMIQFAEVFPEEQIVVSLIRQLSWTHFMEPTEKDRKKLHRKASREILEENDDLMKRLTCLMGEEDKEHDEISKIPDPSKSCNKD